MFQGEKIKYNWKLPGSYCNCYTVQSLTVKFIIADIRRFKKRGNRQEFLLEYEPMILEADIEFLNNFQKWEVNHNHLRDWVKLTDLRRIVGDDEYLKGRIILYQEWHKSKVLEDIKRRGTTLGVAGVIGVDEDVGWIPKG